MNHNLPNTIIFAGILYGFVFCCSVLYGKKYRLVTIKYLILTVLCLTLSNLQYWLMDVGLVIIPDIFYIQFELLIIPFFYFFLEDYLSLSRTKYKWLLFVPFFIGMGYQIWKLPHDAIGLRLSLINPVVEKLVIVFNTILIIVILIKIRAYTKNSDTTSVRINTKWLIQSVIIGSILLLLLLLGNLNFENTKTTNNLSAYYPLWIGMSVLIYFIGTKALVELRIFNERSEIRFRERSVNKSKKHEETVKRPETNSKLDEVKNYIIDQKLFLNPQLNQNMVAKSFGLSSGYISQLFSQYSRDSFIDFINSLRVKEAKKLLMDSIYENYTITAIGLECGFNSKSSFYEVFKSQTNKTPLQFSQSS